MAKKHKGKHRGGRPAMPAARGAGPAPMPGPHEFDAGQEQAMRQGNRAPMALPVDPNEPDADDMGGM